MAMAKPATRRNNNRLGYNIGPASSKAPPRDSVRVALMFFFIGPEMPGLD
jgi:hypothetical protein